MFLEHSTARTDSAAAYTVSEFCQAHRIGRATLYHLWAKNLGPRFFLIGSHRRISLEAAADWRAKAEAAAEAIADGK